MSADGMMASLDPTVPGRGREGMRDGGRLAMLTPEEIEAIRREELDRLSTEEAAREERPFPVGSTPRMEDPEAERRAREREARTIRKAVEEEFWTSRGYERYVTHHGKELWLTPDQIRERKGRRRSRSRGRRNPSEGLLQSEGVRRVLLYLVVLFLGVFLGLQLVR